MEKSVGDKVQKLVRAKRWTELNSSLRILHINLQAKGKTKDDS